MKFDHQKIKTLSNYVLVLPDPVNDTYQIAGSETGIYVGDSAMVDRTDDDKGVERIEETVLTNSQHYSVKGKVYAIPEKLTFNGTKIKKKRLNFASDDGDVAELGRLVGSSLDYDAEMELEVGDEVMFDYLQHIECYEEGKFITTDLGDMYLMRYDSLFLAIKPDGRKVPLNGIVIIEEKPLERITESGLIIPLLIEMEDKITKWSCAEVILAGKPLRGYKQDLTLSDDPQPLKEKDLIMFRPGGSFPLEWVLHQKVFPGQKVLGIRRKDIFMVIPNNFN